MDMNMGASTTSSSMDMMMSTATPTASASASATSSSMSMSMDMGSGSSCKVSMLWNWYTVDSCFISRSWHVTSHGMFAGSCIGVILLVILLEFLRRLGKEYDRFLVRREGIRRCHLAFLHHQGVHDDDIDGQNGSSVHPARFTPTIIEQAVRALLHMLQFAVAYFVMLLAMYYNGYIIICIFIGAYIGSFIFSWESMSLGVGAEQQKTSASQEPTVCCG